jgi:hypothetical protein
MTSDDYYALIEGGIIGKVELLDGAILTNGRWEMVFSPEQARAAAALGVRVRCCVDTVLEDAEARVEAVRRLAEDSSV